MSLIIIFIWRFNFIAPMFHWNFKVSLNSIYINVKQLNDGLDPIRKQSLSSSLILFLFKFNNSWFDLSKFIIDNLKLLSYFIWKGLNGICSTYKVTIFVIKLLVKLADCSIQVYRFQSLDYDLSQILFVTLNHLIIKFNYA